MYYNLRSPIRLSKNNVVKSLKRLQSKKPTIRPSGPRGPRGPRGPSGTIKINLKRLGEESGLGKKRRRKYSQKKINKTQSKNNKLKSKKKNKGRKIIQKGGDLVISDYAELLIKFCALGIDENDYEHDSKHDNITATSFSGENKALKDSNVWSRMKAFVKLLIYNVDTKDFEGMTSEEVNNITTDITNSNIIVDVGPTPLKFIENFNKPLHVSTSYLPDKGPCMFSEGTEPTSKTLSNLIDRWYWKR